MPGPCVRMTLGLSDQGRRWVQVAHFTTPTRTAAVTTRMQVSRSDLGGNMATNPKARYGAQRGCAKPFESRLHWSDMGFIFLSFMFAIIVFVRPRPTKSIAVPAAATQAPYQLSPRPSPAA